MEFFGREEELRSLCAMKQGIAVIYGRRRVGKTELIRQFIKARDSVYFFVNPKKVDLLDEFVETLREKAGLPEYIRPENWKSFIRLVLDVAAQKNIVVAFDEFQRFIDMDESIIPDFQDAWDSAERKPILIFSGSSVGMMKRIFVESKAPLFKRASVVMELKPFNFRDVSRILDAMGVKNAGEKAKLYFVFGGVIYYYVLMSEFGCKSLDDCIDRLILHPHSPIRNEVRDILVEEFGKNYQTYQAIISAISMGKNKRNEIAAHAGVKETSLSSYLYDLMDILSLIGRTVKVTDDWKSRDVRYEITDNFVNFWTRFVLRNESLAEIGDFDSVKQKIREGEGAFFGRRFEKLCGEYLERAKIHGKADLGRIGTWWGSLRDKDGARTNTDIDVISLRESQAEAAFFECKWSEIDEERARKILIDLRERAKAVEWLSGKRKETYGIFAKGISGKDKLLAEGFWAFDLDDLVK
ncbi:MAG: hypothetical protein CVT48_00845 [Thermoplasmata archaeon HGW-Thermoplasmata-1]|nr:MAG: hypothetical protein CVT48_00845 [Thermoplasmata archaeon HGW-Thermoplasmata-1]